MGGTIMETCEAVIFDMDGVVSDTQKIHARLEAEILASLGITISPEEISRRFSGMSLKDQFEALFSEARMPNPYTQDISDMKAEMFMACGAEIVGIKGTLAVIDILHSRVPLAIASASRPPVIDLVLSTLKLKERFGAIVSSRQVARGKPAPDVFLLAASQLGIQPERCVVVEDGISGMIAAKAAGMRCIALAPEDASEYPADIVVDDLRKVPLEWYFG